jgi:hypothetical protein
MSVKSRKIHKETATTVGTGLLINYPLNLFLLFVCIDLWGMTNTFYIGTLITGLMTFVAYVRVYSIRRWFSAR